MARKGGNPDIKKYAVKITPETANAYREKALAVRRSKKEQNEWFEEYRDLALTLASMDCNEFERHFAHPETKREEILLCRFSDPTTAYFTLKDFQEQIQGKPTQKKEVQLEAPKGLSIHIDTAEAAEAIDNLV